jgi:autoinducer 2-degrading protein
MPMYRLVSRFIVPPEHQPAFIKAVRTDREGSLREEAPDTRRLDLIRDERDPNCFYLDEEYVDKDAFDAHAKGPWFRGFLRRSSGRPRRAPAAS